MAYNFSDFYIEYPGHPRFTDLQIIEDDVVKVIIQKWEMILFTNNVDVFCNPGLGGNLISLLHETRLSSEAIENELLTQISLYIPELRDIDYTLNVNFYEDPERYQEYMEIYFELAGYEVYATIT